VFSDRDAFKNRPAIVLSSDFYHRGRFDIVVAAISTRIREPLLPGDYIIADWRTCGLQRPSVITGILRTVKSYLVSNKLGALPADELFSMDELLRNSLGL
jgi:mRNA interferase MazF